ncbi:hypothetical protein GCM10010251_97260 [Streptomyces aurantiogriseus]|uniref:Uncharacterized protein n=1 Tax=Streptomyces aurantiogriseus TaxID=66870 RepID=A0A918FQ06_9ACTN|nr:hypothetical protein GCM10010251_97260 [Streptomyces aurantiogriseus]
MDGAGQGSRRPDQPAYRIGDDLDVHAVPAVFAGVVGLLVGDPVDRDQGAVEDRVREQADSGHRRGQVVGGGGEQVDGLADVAPGGGDTDLESGGQAGQGVAVA